MIAHWITRRVFNDVNVGDWVAYPEAGETLKTLNDYLFTIFGEDPGLDMGNPQDEFYEDSTRKWQFLRQRVAVSDVPVQNELFCNGDVKSIIASHFNHEAEYRRPANDEGDKDPWTGVFGPMMFSYSDNRGIYRCTNAAAKWAFMDGMVYFVDLNDAIKYRLMT